jgi:hypothetical protein
MEQIVYLLSKMLWWFLVQMLQVKGFTLNEEIGVEIEQIIEVDE